MNQLFLELLGTVASYPKLSDIVGNRPTLPGPVQNGPMLAKIVQNCLTLLGIAPNCPKSSVIVYRNSPKLSRIILDYCPIWTMDNYCSILALSRITRNCLKLPSTVRISPKLPEIRNSLDCSYWFKAVWLLNLFQPSTNPVRIKLVMFTLYYSTYVIMRSLAIHFHPFNSIINGSN